MQHQIANLIIDDTRDDFTAFGSSDVLAYDHFCLVSRPFARAVTRYPRAVTADLPNPNREMSDDAFSRLSGMPQAYFERMAAEYPGADQSALRVFLALRAAARRIDNAVAHWLESHNLTLTKMDVLHLVAASADGTTVSRLREHLLMTQPNVTFVVGGLERDGLVRRAADPQDRRSWIVQLTPAGRRLIARMTAAQLDAIARGVTPLSSAERRQLISALAVLTESFEEVPAPLPERA